MTIRLRNSSAPTRNGVNSVACAINYPACSECSVDRLLDLPTCRGVAFLPFHFARRFFVLHRSDRRQVGHCPPSRAFTVSELRRDKSKGAFLCGAYCSWLGHGCFSSCRVRLRPWARLQGK